MLKKDEKKCYQKPKMKVQTLKVQSKLMQPTSLPNSMEIIIDTDENP